MLGGGLRQWYLDAHWWSRTSGSLVRSGACRRQSALSPHCCSPSHSCQRHRNAHTSGLQRTHTDTHTQTHTHRHTHTDTHTHTHTHTQTHREREFWLSLSDKAKRHM